MNKKLTLSLNEEVIEKAKIYAKSNQTSLSRLVGRYLKNITETKKADKNISPLVENISGVIELEEDFDYKEEIRDYLIKKYK